MVLDTHVGDAVPLLAFTLRLLWDRHGEDGIITNAQYMSLGGLEGVLQGVATEELLTMESQSEQQMAALRQAFLQMCRIDEEGIFRKRFARWEEIPVCIRGVLYRFVETRLLVSREGGIEIAHELLIRSWPLLRNWLDEEKEFLIWKRRVERDVEEWLGGRYEEKAGLLLSGLKLERAQKWLETHNDSIQVEIKEFIETSISNAESSGNVLVKLAGSFGLASIVREHHIQKAKYDEMKHQFNELCKAAASMKKRTDEARRSLLAEIPKVFISYAHEDEEEARRVYRQLEEVGFQCWFDKEALLPGVDWDREIRKAINNTDFIVILVSRKACTKRGYVQREIRMALDMTKEVPEGQAYLIPVRIENCDIPEEMSRYHYCDLFRDEGATRLVEAILTHWNLRSQTS
jgi:hypothetical protein